MSINRLAKVSIPKDCLLGIKDLWQSITCKKTLDCLETLPYDQKRYKSAAEESIYKEQINKLETYRKSSLL
ncbi:hypothetical protein CV693_05260 [Borreliella burgdorferi]|nr:hypothetical protein CV693_05260 [Borreliella burgdorferi]